MKTNYHRKSKIYASFLLILAGAIFLTGAYWFWPGVIGETINYLASPVWQLRSNIDDSYHDLRAQLSSKSQLHEENELLKKALIEERVGGLAYRVAVAELQELYQKLDREYQEGIPAAIISRDSASPYDLWVIDRGSRHGITTGDKITVGGRVALGEIISTEPVSSRFKLYSAGGQKTEAILFPLQKNVQVEGTGSGFEFELSLDESVEVGDLLLIPGFEQKIIGEVIRVDVPDTGSFQKVYARLPVDTSQLKYITVGEGVNGDNEASMPTNNE